MLIAENRTPSLEEFRRLMNRTDALLNEEAIGRENYYKNRNGTQLEVDVYEALKRCAVETPFENSIILVSGASFPDIVANDYYGVEVKSTNKNHWKSIGSSILESTRNQSVERIFLTFGKLGAPISFRSRPYEECLSGISVTHYPRYQIDMELNKDETIFSKMGISYDELRKMDNPVAPVSQYYRSLLKPGESLWWADSNVEETVAPPTVKLWNTLTAEEKNFYTVQGYALFPEIFSHNTLKKYQRYALWLATHCGIINTNMRDQFSAGGRIDIVTKNRIFTKVPAVFGRVHRFKSLILDTLLTIDEIVLKEYWQQDSIEEDRLTQWCRFAAQNASVNNQEFEHINILLKSIFNI